MLMTLATKAHQYAFCNILVITNLKFASRKLEITMQKQKLESGLQYLSDDATLYFSNWLLS